MSSLEIGDNFRIDICSPNPGIIFRPPAFLLNLKALKEHSLLTKAADLSVYNPFYYILAVIFFYWARFLRLEGVSISRLKLLA